MNVFVVMPEIFIAVMACVAVLAEVLFAKRLPNIVYYLVQISLIVVTFLTMYQFKHAPVLQFSGLFIQDKLAVLLKLVIYISSFVAFLYSRLYLREHKMASSEYYILGLVSVLGMMIIVSAYNLLTLFLGLELFSLPVYAMVAFRRDSNVAVEAAIKYFVIGALASGMLLYGMSMLYGASHHLEIGQIAKFIALNPEKTPQLILSFGMVFTIVGMAFKLGAVPFHMWVPDVYEGAPSSVVLFLGSAPKIAALGLMFRLLVDAMPDLAGQWQQFLIVIAILSMALGNFAAIVQRNIKRMLAYSSIAHMGYMLLGILSNNINGYGAAVFYMISYAFMTLGAFGLIVIMSRAGFEAENIEDFRGLNSRNPWLALMMLIMMFSLAGIPPLVGFMAKVSVLEALIDANLVWLAAIALVFAIIGAYYYIRVVKVMYFENPVDEKPIVYSRDMSIIFSLNGLLILALGVFPGFLFSLCQACFL
jgi:NADH-quinone oxidoreductase subunit N